MTDIFAAVGDARISRARLVVGNGPWFLECDFEDDTAIAGRVTATLGELTLEGTVAPRHAGTHALQRKAVIVAGAAGWGSPAGPKAYHNDAGVKARTVAEDVARAVGETLGGFAPAAEVVGVDYVRQAGPASKCLEAVAGAPWWVDYAGVTHVGQRPAAALDPDVYEVLEYDPRSRVALLAVDDLTAVGVGSIIAERLDAPQTIRELEIVVEADTLRVHAWCGEPARYGRIADALRDIAARATDGPLFGKYRYRVVRMADGERVDLQAVRRRPGLPDLVPVAIWPGVPGAATPALGTEVLVEFLEGDRAMPIVSNFQTTADGAVEVAYKGATVKVLTPPASFKGTVNGAPATGVILWPTPFTLGTIEVGTPRFKVKPQ